jgi:hypothetical protein
VKEQMGHSSIQVTADIYGHLIPAANVSYVDILDAVPAKFTSKEPQPAATPAQPGEDLEIDIPAYVADSIGGGGQDRTADLGVMKGIRAVTPNNANQLTPTKWRNCAPASRLLLGHFGCSSRTKGGQPPLQASAFCALACKLPPRQALASALDSLDLL